MATMAVGGRAGVLERRRPAHPVNPAVLGLAGRTARQPGDYFGL
jgi:hypothetical protein